MDSYINKALLAADMLTIPEFIKFVEYPIETFMIDRFWNSMENNQLIYVDDALIQWMGYSSSTERNRKIAFNKFLDSYKCGKDYYSYSNDQYQQFLDDRSVIPIGITEIYPSVDRSNGKGKTKHLLLTAECLKWVMMGVSTAKGQQVKKYYTDLETLFKTYSRYQQAHAAKIPAIETVPTKQIEDVPQSAAEKIAELERKLAERESELAESKQEIATIKAVAENPITKVWDQFAKNNNERAGFIYIGSTKTNAALGLFKIGRTNNPKQRTADHNTSHPPNDKYRTIALIKTHDAKDLERRIHETLEMVRCEEHGNEYFYGVFKYLIAIIRLIAWDQRTERLSVEQYLAVIIDTRKQNFITPEFVTEGIPNAVWESGVIIELNQKDALPSLDHCPRILKQEKLHSKIAVIKESLPHRSMLDLVSSEPPRLIESLTATVTEDVCGESSLVSVSAITAEAPIMPQVAEPISIIKPSIPTVELSPIIAPINEYLRVSVPVAKDKVRKIARVQKHKAGEKYSVTVYHTVLAKEIGRLYDRPRWAVLIKETMAEQNVIITGVRTPKN